MLHDQCSAQEKIRKRVESNTQSYWVLNTLFSKKSQSSLRKWLVQVNVEKMENKPNSTAQESE